MSILNEDLYELQWNNHSKILKGSLNIFRTDNALIDVTLSCEGKQLKAHKIILSACSAYFFDLFKENPCKHPIVIMRDIKYQAMVDILNFMYIGEVNVATDNLQTFLKTAEYLQVKGLSERLPKKINISTDSMRSLRIISNETSFADIQSNVDVKDESKKEEEENYETIILDDIMDDPLECSSSEYINRNENNTSKSIKGSESTKKINQSRISLPVDKTSLTQDRQKELHTVGEKSKNIVTKKRKLQKPVEILKLVNTISQSTEESSQLNSMKTEVSDSDSLTNNEMEYLVIDQNHNPEQNEELETQEFIKELSSFETASAYPRQSFPCPHCNKIFNHHISLKLHLPTHSGDTCCPICHSVLGRKYDLKMHMRRKHNVDTDIRFTI